MILGGYQMFSILATESASSAGWISMVVWLVILFAFMYFFMVRPQKKEQQKKNSMLAELAVGDTVLTNKRFLRNRDRHHRRYGDRGVRKQQELPHPDAEGGHLRS